MLSTLFLVTVMTQIATISSEMSVSAQWYFGGTQILS